MWHVRKSIFFLSHGPSFIECGFSVNKELVDTNMKEKTLIAQCIIHDTIVSIGSKVNEFDISSALQTISEGAKRTEG